MSGAYRRATITVAGLPDLTHCGPVLGLADDVADLLAWHGALRDPQLSVSTVFLAPEPHFGHAALTLRGSLDDLGDGTEVQVTYMGRQVPPRLLDDLPRFTERPVTVDELIGVSE